MASLIQQRIALDRQRVFVNIALGIAAFFFAITLVGLVLLGPKNWSSYCSGAIGIIWLAQGLARRAKWARAVRAFEAENGREAGRQ